MIIYSKKIIQFVTEIKTTLKTILSHEVGLKVSGDRFYDKNGKISYPIKVVVYNNKSMLGYFDSEFYEIGFHECLMHTGKEKLYAIIKHELAHYITFIDHGRHILPHGSQFKGFCQLMGWDEEVSNATICLDENNNFGVLEKSNIFRKVQKLMALATSSNQNEAEQAIIKSQQLLLKHNLESTYVGSDDDKIFLKRIIKQKRENAKMRAIANILETFFVSPVYNRAGEHIYLEILGDAVNIEIAEYVAEVLDSELEKLWSQAQKHANLKGAIAKNSFFLGLAKGYCDKIQALKRVYNSEVTNALMIIEKKLVDGKAMAYDRLTKGKSSGGHCAESSELGRLMGRQLNINPAINKSTKSPEMLIFHYPT